MKVFSKAKDLFVGEKNSKKQQQLFDHVKRGDLDYIQKVEPDLLLKAKTKNFNTALSLATIKGHFNLCEEILQKCPSLLYGVHDYRMTVLHQAAHLVGKEVFRFIDLFVSAGMDAATSSNEEENKRFSEWVRMQDSWNDTALLVAVYYGNLHVVQKFVEIDRHYKLGLSKIVGKRNKTALQLAMAKKDLEMVKLLSDKGDPPYSDFVPYLTAMDLLDGVWREDLDYIKTVELHVLLNSRDQDRMSALSIATINDQLDCCKEILKRCPSLLYHQNNNKESVLHLAANNDIYRLVDFFVSVGLDAVKSEGDTENMTCFKKWINLQRSDDHNTALIVAVCKRNLDIVQRFIDVDRQYKLRLSEIVGDRKMTALQWAEENKDDDMIKALTVIGDSNHDANISISIDMQQAQESLQTGKGNGTEAVAGENNFFTLDEVSKHNNSKDCWLVINDKVYDVTNFLGDHPGGSEVLLKASGKDATNDFMKVQHRHSSNAMTMMDKFYVGMCDSITTSLKQLAKDKPQPYSRQQLKDFTKNFSHPLGSGGFGDVFKGQFPDDGAFIAVKVLKNIDGKEKIMEEQFMAEVNTMGRAYHRNLIKLYGYCYEANTKYKALVYDYMENGSFHMILFKKKLDIPWAKMHSIAKEIAQGISYLHESCYPQIIHLDIKPANVLLDSNLSPKVIDFGLAKVNNEGSKFEQSKIKGSRDYMAPEVNQINQVKLSFKCDVYSFGMMLFDILGSKRNQVDKSWFPGQVWEKYKRSQLGPFVLECGIKEEDKEKAMRLAIVALLCVEHNPLDRPMLSNVIKMLEGTIKQLDTPITPFYPNYYLSTESSSTSDSRDS